MQPHTMWWVVNSLGAFGVSVGGNLYDVTFQDGTCISLFSGCDEASDFTFNSGADADAASQALIDQVFNGDDSYDAQPELTRGIEDLQVGAIMTVYTAQPGNPNGAMVDFMQNFAGIAGDINFCGLGGCSVDKIWDVASPGFTYAKWAPASGSAVPVPAAVWLFGSALIGFVGMSRRRKVA